MWRKQLSKPKTQKRQQIELFKKIYKANIEKVRFTNITRKKAAAVAMFELWRDTLSETKEIEEYEAFLKAERLL